MKGRAYHGEVCELGEVVLWKNVDANEHKFDDRFCVGVWLGKNTRNDDHLVFDDEVKKCRTVQRRTEARRWNLDKLLAVDALPWLMKPERVKLREPIFKRKYITWAYVRKYGGTPGCKACSVDGPAHSAACRERFEELFAKEREDELARAAMRAAASPPSPLLCG